MRNYTSADCRMIDVRTFREANTKMVGDYAPERRAKALQKQIETHKDFVEAQKAGKG